MKKYTALFAIDVPHYGSYDIEAQDDDAAIAAAEALYKAGRVQYDDPTWEYAGVARIVHIEDPDGDMIIEDKALDECFIRYGGEADRLLCENAQSMLNVLEHAIFTEEGNWDGPDDEPDWLQQARVVTAKARGQS